GIRGRNVTGVQTGALPISRVPVRRRGRLFSELAIHLHVPELIQRVKPSRRLTMRSRHYQGDFELPDLPIHRSVRGVNAGEQAPRSEERRVGKEGRARWMST